VVDGARDAAAIVRLGLSSIHQSALANHFAELRWEKLSWPDMSNSWPRIDTLR
jgi:hypothetical protein